MDSNANPPMNWDCSIKQHTYTVVIFFWIAPRDVTNVDLAELRDFLAQKLGEELDGKWYLFDSNTSSVVHDLRVGTTYRLLKRVQ